MSQGKSKMKPRVSQPLCRKNNSQSCLILIEHSCHFDFADHICLRQIFIESSPGLTKNIRRKGVCASFGLFFT